MSIEPTPPSASVPSRRRALGIVGGFVLGALLLYGLQIAIGLLSAAKYLGPDPLLHILPFDRAKEIHTNLLIVWVLTGFMGAAYYVVPEESRTGMASAGENSRCNSPCQF